MTELTVQADRAQLGIPLFPAHPVDGLAGTSFKHQHLPAILADDEWTGGFMRKTTWEQAARRMPH